MVTGWDAEVITQNAQRLTTHVWDAREAFHFVAPTRVLAECIDVALQPDRRLFFILDSLRILARPEFQGINGPTVVYASIPGQQAAETIARAHVGSTITVVAGAKVDSVHEGPITLIDQVHAIRYGDRDASIECVLQAGSVFMIITKLRKPYHHESDFIELKLEPRSADIVIVKIGRVFGVRAVRDGGRLEIGPDSMSFRSRFDSTWTSSNSSAYVAVYQDALISHDG